MPESMPRNSILYLRRDLGPRLARGTRVRLLAQVPALLARDATGEPLQCDAAALCLLPDAPGFEQVVIDPEFLTAIRPADEDLDCEAAARAALVDSLSGDAGGPNAHLYDPLARGHTFEDEYRADPSRGLMVALEDLGDDDPADPKLAALVRRLDTHRGAFGEPETCLIGDGDAGPDEDPARLAAKASGDSRNPDPTPAA